MSGKLFSLLCYERAELNLFRVIFPAHGGLWNYRPLPPFEVRKLFILGRGFSLSCSLLIFHSIGFSSLLCGSAAVLSRVLFTSVFIQAPESRKNREIK